MSIDFRTQSELKRILLNSNGNGKNKPEPQELEAEEDVKVVAPETREITASVSDVLAMQNMVMISTSHTTPVLSGSYELPEGRVVIHVNEDGNIGFQYHGYGDITLKELRKLVQKGLTPVEVQSYNNGVNGEIDESVSQGGTGDCWILTGILSLTATAEGKALIKSSLEIQDNGDVIVNFKGLGYSIRVTAAEIKKHDTDNIKGDAFSNGDNDMLVFELAVEKLFEQHPELKETYGYNEEGKGDDKYITQGGFGNDLVEWLSGNKAEDLCTMDKLENPYDKADVVEWVAVPSGMTRYQGEYPRPSSISLDAMFNDDKTNFSSEYINWYNKTFVPIIKEYNQSALNGLVDGLSQEEVMAKLQEAYENQPCAVTFGLYVFANDTHKVANDINGVPFNWEYYNDNVENGELCGHAFAVVGMTQDTITFVNPWDSTEKITMSWEEFSKLGIGRIAYNKLDNVEDSTKPTTPDPVTPDEPVNPASPYDKSVAELKAQGFSQADIDEYFDISEDGTYTMKSDIKFKGYQSISDAVLHRNYSEISITTIEELKDYCGANQRQALKEEGWSDELIDKYFSKHKKYNGKMYYSFSNNGNTEFFDGHGESFDSNANNKGYTITKNKDGSTIISIKRADGETKITVKTDGTYTEDFIRDALCLTPDELKQKGFTQEQIDEWFTEVADGVYKMDTNQALASGDYSNSLKTFNSIEELAKYIGADSRATLKSQGIPDEIIDKFFELKRTGANGSFSYELKIEGNYTITEQGENKLIRIENKEDDTITEILVKKDGTYTIETNEIITIGEKEEANPVAGSVNELLAQGFTQADINKYFYKKNNQYYLKSDITFQKRGANGYETVNIRTLEELKEYSGANSRKALKDQGLPDELIDKYYHKRTENGKIVYTSDNTSIGKDGNNTVLTWSDWKSNDNGGATCREYTIKPDGTYTVVEYTSKQITDTTRTHYMLTEKGLSEQDIQKFFTEKDGLYTLKKGIMFKKEFITTVEELVDALNKNK